ELAWLIEHPPLYTAGTSAKPEQLLAARLPVFAAGRGGQFTYHGPGQQVVYVMLDLKRRGGVLRRYVATLEEWIIRTLAALGIVGGGRVDRVGLGVGRPGWGDGRAREHRLHRTVAPVADPAFEATRERGVLGPGAKADALYVPAYHYVSDRLIVCRIAAHPTSPVSLARAPRQLDGDQRCSVRI